MRTEDEKQKTKRIAARATLVVLAVVFVLLGIGVMRGFDSGTLAFSSIAALIVGPVLVYFMVWSLTSLMRRRADSENELPREERTPSGTEDAPPDTEIETDVRQGGQI